MDAFSIAMLAAALLVVVGVAVFVAGLFSEDTATRRRAGDPNSGFLWILKNSWKILFPPRGAKPYPTDQRRMAGGLLLIALGALLALGALGALGASKLTDGGGGTSPKPSPSASATATP